MGRTSRMILTLSCLGTERYILYRGWGLLLYCKGRLVGHDGSPELEYRTFGGMIAWRVQWPTVNVEVSDSRKVVRGSKFEMVWCAKSHHKAEGTL